MKILFLLLLLSPQLMAKECLILLHGMGRSSWAMENIEERAIEEGYIVWNKTHPSTEKEIKQNAIDHISEGLNFCKKLGSTAIHFATHSLGGILVRSYLQDNEIDNLGKIVMLAPPNHGSELAQFLKDTPILSSIYEWKMGPAGQKLGTSEDDIPLNLEPIPGEIGIIAGSLYYEFWFFYIFDRPHDGKVAVESTFLEEMKDFILMPNTHTFIMMDDPVIDQVMHFIKEGSFLKNEKFFEDGGKTLEQFLNNA